MYHHNEPVIAVLDYELEDAEGNKHQFKHAMIVSGAAMNKLVRPSASDLRRVRDMFNQPNVGSNEFGVMKAPSQKLGIVWARCNRVSVREANEGDDLANMLLSPEPILH